MSYTENLRFTLDLTADQFWECFLDGPYIWTEFWRETYEGSHSQAATEWLLNANTLTETANPWNFMECDGVTAQKVRRFESKIMVVGIPLLPATEAFVQKTFALLQRNKETLIYKVVTRVTGTPYCDTNQVEEMWQVSGSCPVTLTQSYKVHFFSRPYLVSGKIQSNLEQAQKTTLEKWKTWAEQKVAIIQTANQKQTNTVFALKIDQAQSVQPENQSRIAIQESEETKDTFIETAEMLDSQQLIGSITEQPTQMQQLAEEVIVEKELISNQIEHFSQQVIEESTLEKDPNEYQVSAAINTLDIGIGQTEASCTPFLETKVMDFSNSFKSKKVSKPQASSDLDEDQKNDDEPITEIPRNLTITNAQMAHRKVLDQRRWHCLARPQHPKSCGISSLTSCWNYLFSTLGTGTHRPISTEEALEVLGFKPPYTDVKFGSFTGNDTLIQWFGLLNRYFKVQGEAKICFKLHGNSVTSCTETEALASLKEGLRGSKTYIYHCFNHYMCPIGFEENPTKPHQAYSVEPSEIDDWIIVGDISKMHPCFHVKRWKDIYQDINCAYPSYYNIRKPELGVMQKQGKAFQEGGKQFGGNLHCIIEFSKTEEVKNVKEYLKKELKDVLVEALAACAVAKPDNPVRFVCEFLARFDQAN